MYSFFEVFKCMTATRGVPRGNNREVIVKQAGGFCKPSEQSAVECPGRDIIPG